MSHHNWHGDLFAIQIYEVSPVPQTTFTSVLLQMSEINHQRKWPFQHQPATRRARAPGFCEMNLARPAFLPAGAGGLTFASRPAD